MNERYVEFSTVEKGRHIKGFGLIIIDQGKVLGVQKLDWPEIIQPDIEKVRFWVEKKHCRFLSDVEKDNIFKKEFDIFQPMRGAGHICSSCENFIKNNDDWKSCRFLKENVLKEQQPNLVRFVDQSEECSQYLKAICE